MIDRIGVIICNYNYSEYVVRSIESAITQDLSVNLYRQYKIYFVDDGSTDGSWEIVKERFACKNIEYVTTSNGTYEFFKYGNLDCYRIENSGASNARNFLIEMALRDKMDYLAILDSDDYMVSNKIKTLLNVMKKYDEIGVVYADYILNKPNYSVQEFKECYSLPGLYRSCIVHSGSLIRTEYLKQVRLENGEFYKTCLHGPASGSFIGCTEDYDLWFRLSKVCMFAHCPSALTIVNEHGRNQSSKMTPEIFQDNIRRMDV
jgi:glycosyltransferase involved in cell wall biosynthesis